MGVVDFGMVVVKVQLFSLSLSVACSSSDESKMLPDVVMSTSVNEMFGGG